LLFSLFINDLEKYLLENYSGSIKINSTPLCLLLFADVLVFLSDLSTGLQKSIQFLGDYCSKWDRRINLEKTKVTKMYRYLGIVITSNGILKSATDTQAKQGQKSPFCLLKKASKLQFPNPIVLSHLFDSLV